MNIKLADYSLRYSYHNKDVQHGDYVCPSNGSSSVGRITDIKGDDDSYEGKTYTVVWGTGKKRGKQSDHRGHTLVLLKLYLASVNRDTNRINALIQEASTLGM